MAAGTTGNPGSGSKDKASKPGTSGRGMMPDHGKVLILTGKEKVHRFHKNRVVIGTVDSADIRLQGDGVSPLHAVIELTQDPVSGAIKASIYDLASDTGVFIDGKKVITTELKGGDDITIGINRFKFTLGDVAQIQPTDRVREVGGRKLFMNPNEDFSPLLLQDERDVEEIFDYAETAKQALEVVMSWRGTILDVEHFVSRPQVTIGGTKDCDFVIPPVLSAKSHVLASKSGEGFSLNLDPKMKGIIQREGTLESLESIKAQAMPGHEGYALQFQKGQFAKISIGEVDFYLSYTSAPPRLKRQRLIEKDFFFFKILMSSLLLTVLTVVSLLKMSVPQTLEAEQLPERIATILYQPEKYPARVVREPTPPKNTQVSEKTPPPKKTEPKVTKVDITPNPNNAKKPVPKEMNVGKKANANQAPKVAKAAGGRPENEAKEGKGARAKGPEGTRGSRKAPPGSTPQNMASRPSPQGGTGRGGGNSQVADQGNLDVLKGATSTIQNLLAGSSAKLGKGGEKLEGFGGFTTQGKGGLALSGSGSGGGGDADSLGGLAKSGRGGGRVGTGLGAAGNGNGIIGGKARVVIRSGGDEEAVVMGAIDADAIEAALLAHKDEFRLCYEKEINAENPKLAGRIGTSFVIGSSGRVTQAGIESSSLKNANTERCVLTVIRRIQFPTPRGGGIVQVTYPFKFNAVGG